jgi:hypothetical protein
MPAEVRRRETQAAVAAPEGGHRMLRHSFLGTHSSVSWTSDPAAPVPQIGVCVGEEAIGLQCWPTARLDPVRAFCTNS